ncbi:MAG: hypothetical protein RLZZ44_682 [Bacteroidota bacterium]
MKVVGKAIVLLSLVFSLQSTAQVIVDHLTTDMGVNPLGVSHEKPKLGWQLVSQDLNISQKYYQIIVSSSQEKIQNNQGDFWNTGKLKSTQSQLIAYTGKPLQTETKYFWKVKIWDQKGKPSHWSKPAFFRVAPAEKDLNPIWIGAILKSDSHLPEGRNYHAVTFKKEKKEAIVNAVDTLARKSILLRKTFSVSKKIKEAVVYLSGLGHYELTINNKKIGNSQFAPLWTDYDKTVYFNTYELSANDLQNGSNVIGVLLGNGMYNMVAERYAKFYVSFGPPTLFFKMKVTYEDGSQEIVQSDASWKYSLSPITYNSIFGGEDYNANLEQQGWNTVNFDDQLWEKVVLQEAPKGKLVSQTAAPVQIEKQFDVKEFKEVQPSIYVFNMGQNVSGFPTIKVKGNKGQTIRIWVGESVNDDGTIGQGRSGKPYFYNYTLKGEGIEEWHPKFSYYGYQYVQIDNVNYKEVKKDQLPLVIDVTSNFVYNASGEAGTFECSNPIFTKAHELINNAIKSNFQSVFTDCPHREKLGWIEETHLNGPGLFFNYNLQTYIPGLMQNIADAQRPNGLIPSVVPEYVVFGGDFTDSPEWGVAGVVLPWMYYEYYGDRSLIEKYYPVMKKYIDYLTGTSKNGIVSHGLGDWYDYGPHPAGYSKNSPIALSATSHYYFGADLVAKAAKLLHKKEDYAYYSSLTNSIKNAFNKTFFNEEKKQYGTGSQFSNSVPLFMDMVSPSNKAAVLNNLVQDIKNREYRLTTGDVGNRYLFQTLARNNQNEVMYKMHNHTDAPGYGFQIKFGLTTLTEQWDPRKGNSWNHFMLGQIEEWFYQSLAGIVSDDAHPGFKHFFIQPELVGDLSFVKSSYQSNYGLIVSEWEKKDAKLVLSVTIPANTTATIKLPVRQEDIMKINGKSLKQLELVSSFDQKSSKSNITLGSGSYSIECKL